jgi:hypothetical protein
MKPKAPKRLHKLTFTLRDAMYQAVMAACKTYEVTPTETVRGWVIQGLRTGTPPDGVLPPHQTPGRHTEVHI